MNKDLKNIKNNICNALKIFYVRESYLLKRNLHEITIAHKFACILEKFFSEYDVDIEFNRELSKAKVYFNSKRKPDIIIHKRGHNKDNLIIIEIKKSNNRNINYDYKKLICALEKFHYKYGVYIEFNINKTNKYFISKIKIFENELKVKEYEWIC